MWIRLVDEDEVNVTEVEVLERLFDGLDDVLAIEAARFSAAANEMEQNPLIMITLGLTESDNINRMITLTNYFYLVVINKWDA